MYFRHLAASARVEGEDPAAGREQRGVALGRLPGLPVVLEGARRVGGAGQLAVPFRAQGAGVGLVPQGDRCAVEVADGQRVPGGERLPLGVGQAGEEPGDVGGEALAGSGRRTPSAWSARQAAAPGPGR
ncbi:hypothetical protein O1L44_24050 [Streptomyces noursei]|nr:hypothetical protein [Streptomyces noursei]